MRRSATVALPKAAWLLWRLQLLRLARQATSGFRRSAQKQANAKRVATFGKSRQSLLIGSLVAVAIVAAYTNLARQTVLNVETAASSVSLSQKPAPQSSPAVPRPPGRDPRGSSSTRMPPPAPGFAFPWIVLQSAVLLSTLFLVAVTLMSIGNGELTQASWDLEWLSTLPVPLSTLLYARIVSGTLNPIGLYTLLPFLSVLAWEAGHRISAPFFALAAATPLLIIAATVRTLCDTGLRLRLGPSQLRNLQAIVAILALLALLLAISPAMPTGGGYVLRCAVAVPEWALWSPPGLAIQAIGRTSGATEVFALLIMETALCAMLGVALMKQELRLGVIAAGARESVERRFAQKAPGAMRAPPPDRLFLTPIQARELRLLGRDRTFLVQTLVMPVILVGAQIFLNTSGAKLMTSASAHPELLASIAFGISAYALMFSAFQTLNAEGSALWILYGVPQSLESILRQKAVLWGTASLIYPLAIFSFMIVSGGISLLLMEFAALVFLGVAIFAVIATSLGVFACDPLAQNVRMRVKPSYIYLYMLLSSLYIYSVYAVTVAQRLVFLILTSLLAFALWQKARDRLPYLLDPSEAAPARVSVSDGLIAALLFFVLQGLVILIRVHRGQTLTGYDVLIAFSAAGAVTFAIMRLAFWRLKSAGVPRMFGHGALRAAALGAAAGLVAAIGALIYIEAALHTSLFKTAQQTVLLQHGDVWLLALLAVVAAPIFEEFIFRGLIFGGLRRSAGVTVSVLASAAIFAIVHPPVAALPVFGLGVATALVYERTKILIGPMTAHAAYNAAVIGFQGLL